LVDAPDVFAVSVIVDPLAAAVTWNDELPLIEDAKALASELDVLPCPYVVLATTPLTVMLTVPVSYTVASVSGTTSEQGGFEHPPRLIVVLRSEPLIVTDPVPAVAACV